MRMKGEKVDMKISNEFALREVAGNFIVVPFGKKAVSFNAMITLNESGAFLWKQLEEEKTEQELTNAMLQEYNVDYETAKADIAAFLVKLRTASIIE